MNIIGDIDGKNCILIDDIIDTAGTICQAALALRKNGAKKVYGCASHGVLSGEAFTRLENSIMEKFVISNTIAVPEEKLGKVLEVVNVAPIFASAIRRINGNKSVSEMFD